MPQAECYVLTLPAPIAACLRPFAHTTAGKELAGPIPVVAGQLVHRLRPIVKITILGLHPFDGLFDVDDYPLETGF